MSAFLDRQKKYGGENYEIIECKPFDEEDRGLIKSAKVVPSEYGASVCLFMRAGYKLFIPVSRDTDYADYLNKFIDLDSCMCLTLKHKTTGDIIDRIEF